MHEAVVTISRLDGAFAWVEPQRQSACGSCGSSAHCGTGVLAKLLGREPREMLIENLLDALPGETVVVGIPDAALIRASLAAYLMPLLSMTVPAAVADAYGLGNLGVAIVALCGFSLGLHLAGRFTNGSSGRYRPRMLRRRSPEVVLSKIKQGVFQ